MGGGKFSQWEMGADSYGTDKVLVGVAHRVVLGMSEDVAKPFEAFENFGDHVEFFLGNVAFDKAR